MKIIAWVVLMIYTRTVAAQYYKLAIFSIVGDVTTAMKRSGHEAFTMFLG
jgi:hypothetical protein